MSITESIADRVSGGKMSELESTLSESQDVISGLKEVLESEGEYNSELSERLAELELALEDVGWMRMAYASDQEFSRHGMEKIVKLCRLMYLKNPLVQRAVLVQSYYVWGQDFSIEAKHPEVDAIIQRTLKDSKNASELMDAQAREHKEVEASTASNLFFAFFVNASTGATRIRTIPFEEIADIIYNPDDDQDPWYYKRVWTEKKFVAGLSNPQTTETRTAYYPDWRHNPSGGHHNVIGGHPVVEVPVYHAKAGGFPKWSFGVPWVYTIIDWARAYKEFLEDWASIVRTYKRFAWLFKTKKGGKKGVAKAKTKLNSTLSTDKYETNPLGTGAVAVMSGDQDLQPIKTAGAVTKAEDARQLLLMVCAGSGLPETFFGDVSKGNHATASTLDRPTELMFVARQGFWREVYGNICNFVVDQAVKALNGPLAGNVEINDFGELEVIMPTDPETGEPMDRTIDIHFPPILEHSMKDIVEAATKTAQAGAIDSRTLAKMCLTALGWPNVDELVDLLFPEGEYDPAEDVKKQGALLPVPPGSEAPEGEQAESLMLEAIAELREAVLHFAEHQAA